MAVSVDCSAYVALSKAPSNAVTKEENLAPQTFADCFQQAVNDEFGEPSAPLVAEVDSEEAADKKSAKKMSEEEAAALLMLFLFSQQMSPATHPPTSASDEVEVATHSVEASSPLSGEKSHAELDAAFAEEGLEEPDATQGMQKTQTKAAANNPEAKASAEMPTDKALAAQPAKTPSTPASNLQTGLPLPQEDKRRTALSESAPLPRSLPSSHATSLAASQAVLPSAEAQSAALPLRSGQFSELLSQRVMWLSSQNLQSAQIELSPKELGTLEVRVALAAGGAEVQLGSQQAEVRSVLEGQLYRLQEMLENQGLPAPRLGIFDSSQAQQHKEQGGRPSRAAKPTSALEAEESAVIQSVGQQTLIDYYA